MWQVQCTKLEVCSLPEGLRSSFTVLRACRAALSAPDAVLFLDAACCAEVPASLAWHSNFSVAVIGVIGVATFPFLLFTYLPTAISQAVCAAAASASGSGMSISGAGASSHWMLASAAAEAISAPRLRALAAFLLPLAACCTKVSAVPAWHSKPFDCLDAASSGCCAFAAGAVEGG